MGQDNVVSIKISNRRASRVEKMETVLPRFCRGRGPSGERLPLLHPGGPSPRGFPANPPTLRCPAPAERSKMGKHLPPRQELRGPTSLTLPGEGNPHCFLQN
jgi:hypothetical protein